MDADDADHRETSRVRRKVHFRARLAADREDRRVLRNHRAAPAARGAEEVESLFLAPFFHERKGTTDGPYRPATVFRRRSSVSRFQNS